MEHEHPHTVSSIEEEEHEDQEFQPKGTLLFVILMLAGYALYWAFLWFLVVIERGGAEGFI
jgi:hypothetical protein